MLKIKDNVDLKELEQYLVRLNIIDGDDCIESNVYCLIDNENKDFVENNCINDYFVDCYFDKENKLSFCNYPEQINWKSVINMVHELTKENILEKIDD